MKSLRNPNRKPTNPGAILREDVLPSLGMDESAFAQSLGVSCLTVSGLLSEKLELSADHAARLSHVVGGSPQSWFYMQEALSIWEAHRRLQGDAQL